MVGVTSVETFSQVKHFQYFQYLLSNSFYWSTQNPHEVKLNMKREVQKSKKYIRFRSHAECSRRWCFFRARPANISFGEKINEFSQNTIQLVA